MNTATARAAVDVGTQPVCSAIVDAGSDGHRDDALMRALLLRVHERCDAMNSQSVALTLNALMRLRWEDAPLVARLSSLARDNIKKFSAKELVIVTNALSNLDYADRSDLGGSEVHVAALSSAIRRKAKLLDRHGVTLALEALKVYRTAQ